MKWSKRTEQIAIAAIGTAMILAIVAIMVSGCITVKAPDGTETVSVDVDTWLAITNNTLELAEAGVRRWQAYERAQLEGATNLMYDAAAIAEGLSEALARRDVVKAINVEYRATKAAQAPQLE